MNRLVAALLLGACAAGASAQTEPPAAEPDPSSAAASDIVVKGDKPKKVCHTERATGSIMPRRVCRTAEQVAAQQEAALRSKDYMTGQLESMRETQVQR